MDYGFAHGLVFTPNGTSVTLVANDARNAAIERDELAVWAQSPDLFTAYYKIDAPGRELELHRSAGSSWLTGAVLTTWIGTAIGRIVSARVYRHNFGGRMVAITAIGSNGATYHGRASWDGGTVITIRKAKG